VKVVPNERVLGFGNSEVVITPRTKKRKHSLVNIHAWEWKLVFIFCCEKKVKDASLNSHEKHAWKHTLKKVVDFS
jgi:hypothetical protein